MGRRNPIIQRIKGRIAEIDQFISERLAEVKYLTAEKGLLSAMLRGGK